MSPEQSIKLDVVLLPRLIPEANIKGAISAVIDVLRATTTIVTALSSGASRVIPFMNASEVRAHAATLPEGTCLLGGEEKSLKIPGFDLGNSPLEYLASGALRGRVILFSTTNGTPTMRLTHKESGAPVYIATLANASTIAEEMTKQAKNSASRKIALVCSGRHGDVSAEDTFCAGLIAAKINDLLIRNGVRPLLNDAAMVAMGFAEHNSKRAYEVLSGCEHGRSLLELGFTDDLKFASQVDRFDTAPVFNGEHIVPG